MSDAIVTEVARRYAAAVELAALAGARTLKVFQTSQIGVQAKQDGTPVTIADRDAEEFLRGEISKRFPGDGVLGEEFGETAGTTGVRWVLDPIDGTKAFVCGVPLFGTLVGVEFEGVPRIGVIELPALGERVHAASGCGAVWERRGVDDVRARVSMVEELKDAVLCTTDPLLFDRVGARERLMGLERNVRVCRGWNDCYAYALLATGRVDVVVDPVMALWDIVPLVPIVMEAGGMISDWRGNPDPRAERCVASNGRVHRAVLRYFN